MSWLIVGTVPDENFPLVDVPCQANKDSLVLGEHTVSIARGTPALLAAAAVVAKVLGVEPPTAILAGDIGKGDGSVLVYPSTYQKEILTLDDYRPEQLQTFFRYQIKNLLPLVTSVFHYAI